MVSPGGGYLAILVIFKGIFGYYSIFGIIFIILEVLEVFWLF